MTEQRNETLPEHLEALLRGDDGTLRSEIEKALGGSLDRLSTGRMGRAFKMGRLAVGGGAKMAFGKARQLLKGGGGAVLETGEGVALAAQMLLTFSELRGIAMKVGQMLSYLDDMLPPEAQRILALLQRDASPMPWETVHQVLCEEHGRPPEESFAYINPTPMAAASIGQVHEGRLHDGTRVAIKVQYPGIEKAMRADLKNARVGALFKRALFINTDMKAVMDEIEQRFIDECDYRKEAAFQEIFYQRLKGHPLIVVPKVHHELVSARVLVTTLEEGKTFYQWLDSDPSPKEREQMSRAFYRFYIGSFYMDGIFHCDPHPGNFLFRDDGKIVFLDYGCARQFTEERRKAWIGIASIVPTDDREAIEAAAQKVGFTYEGKDYDWPSFRKLMRHLYDPYLVDEPYDFAKHKPAQTFRLMFLENPNLFKMNMPADAVFLNRITFGLVSLMSEIGAVLNVNQMSNAYFEMKDPDWPEDPVLIERARLGADGADEGDIASAGI